MPTGIPNKKCTCEFKHHVIETMRAEKLSYKETMRQFEVGNHHAIQRWKRIYLVVDSDPGKQLYATIFLCHIILGNNAYKYLSFF